MSGVGGGMCVPSRVCSRFVGSGGDVGHKGQ